MAITRKNRPASMMKKMKRCINDCQKCISMCKKMGNMKECIKSCEDCIECCMMLMKCKFNNKYLEGCVKQMCKEACLMCASVCKKHEHKECQECAHSCEECASAFN